MDENIRLSKLMSERGLCSRREADTYIAKGWVRVDGQIIDQLGTKVSPKAKIELSQQFYEEKDSKVTVILNKPIGYVSSQPEPGYLPAIRLISEKNQYRQEGCSPLLKQHFKKLVTAGRLDINSQGLLVFTQDGALAKRLINTNMEKEYIVRVKGSLSEKELALLNHGLVLDGQRLRPAKVSWLNADQLQFILYEGKKRQIRRMCDEVGLEVLGLKRVRVGRLTLGSLPEGKWRFLKPNEKF